MVNESGKLLNFRWGSNRWAGSAISDDGKHMTMVSDYQGRGQILVSHTSGGVSGTSWQDTGGFGGTWSDVCMSSGGNIQYVCSDKDKTYKSTTSGNTWVELSAADVNVNRRWKCCACSSNGSVVAFGWGSGYGYIYISTDAGATFTTADIDEGVGKNWKDISMSNDGTKMLACNLDGEIWFSNDTGVTWHRETVASAVEWVGIAMSGDGTKATAVSVERFGTPRLPGHVWTATIN